MTRNHAVTLAVDVGGTSIKCAVIDESGSLRYADRHLTGAERGPAAVVATILDAAAGLADHARDLGLDPIAAGVVVPSVVTGGIAVWSANLGLRDVPLRDLVADRTGLPAVLGHDVRAGALAEARLGAGRATRRLLFVAIGTGIAGGFVLDGEIDHGAHGAAGEIGHVAVRTGPQAPACRCGGRGCLEMYASAAAIARAYAYAAGQVSPVAAVPTMVDAAPGYHGSVAVTSEGAEGVARRVHDGDPLAQQVWAGAVEALADGLLTAIAFYDPSVIALGGGLAEAEDVLLDPLRTALEQRRTFHQLPQVVQAELGDSAGCHGAAILAWDLIGRHR